MEPGAGPVQGHEPHFQTLLEALALEEGAMDAAVRRGPAHVRVEDVDVDLVDSFQQELEEWGHDSRPLPVTSLALEGEHERPPAPLGLGARLRLPQHKEPLLGNLVAAGRLQPEHPLSREAQGREEQPVSSTS